MVLIPLALDVVARRACSFSFAVRSPLFHVERRAALFALMLLLFHIAIYYLELDFSWLMPEFLTNVFGTLR